MKRITLDTNVVGSALKRGTRFRKRVERGEYQVFIPETTLTLDGLLNHAKINLLALKGVKHAFNKSKWDGYVGLGIRFLLCPRIELPRPKHKDAHGNMVEYTLLHKAAEHTYSQKDRQSRYSEAIRYIQDKLGAGQKLLSDLQNEIQSAGGNYQSRDPWFLNLANNLAYLGEKKVIKRFGDWADADSIASHYAYGNDIFCTNDVARGAGSVSVMSEANKRKIEERFEIEFRKLNELA